MRIFDTDWIRNEGFFVSSTYCSNRAFMSLCKSSHLQRKMTLVCSPWEGMGYQQMITGASMVMTETVHVKHFRNSVQETDSEIFQRGTDCACQWSYQTNMYTLLRTRGPNAVIRLCNKVVENGGMSYKSDHATRCREVPKNGGILPQTFETIVK